MSQVNNIALINKLSHRLRTVAVSALQNIQKKGKNPFITIPEKTKEGELAKEFTLKLRDNKGKPVEDAALVSEVVEPFTKKKKWKINVNGCIVTEGVPTTTQKKETEKTTGK